MQEADEERRPTSAALRNSAGFARLAGGGLHPGKLRHTRELSAACVSADGSSETQQWRSGT